MDQQSCTQQVSGTHDAPTVVVTFSAKAIQNHHLVGSKCDIYFQQLYRQETRTWSDEAANSCILLASCA